MSSSSVIVLDDSSEEEAPMEGGRSAPLFVSSSDDEHNETPSHHKKPRVASPVAAARSSPAKARKGLSYSSASEAESSDVEDEENDASDRYVAIIKEKKKQVERSGTSDGAIDTADGDFAAPAPLLFASANGLYSDGMSYSDQQAQIRELERFQRKAHRKQTAGSPREANTVPRTTARRATATGAKRKASVSAVSSHSSPHPHSKGPVLKKTTSPSPFEFDFPGASDDSTPSSAAEEPAAVSRAHAKPMSLKDVVAQERELAQLRKQNMNKTSSSVDLLKTKKGGQKLPIFFFGRQTHQHHIDSTDSSAVESNEEDEDSDAFAPQTAKRQKTRAQPARVPEVPDSDSEDDEDSDAEYMPKPSKETSQTARPSSTPASKSGNGNRKNKAVRRKRGALNRKASSSGGKRTMHPTPSPQPAIISDTLDQPRNAGDTVMHSTLWRDVCVEVAPPNLLALDSEVALPFDSACDLPLLTYDEDGDLRSKCKFVATFGKATQFMSSALVNGTPEQVLTQEEMDTRVTDVIKTQLPRIRACHRRKTTAILAEARAKVGTYLAAHEAHREKLPPLNSHPLGVSVLEKTLLNQMKQEKLSGTVSLEYVNFWGESTVTEERLCPRDVNQLPSIRPLSRSTAFVGVKANVRVEDDPILRYVPYFGDNDDGRDIDVAWYDGVGSKESSLSSGLDGEVNEHLLRLVVRECGDSDKVFNALKNAPGFAQAYSDYGEIKKANDSVRVAARRIKEANGLVKNNAPEFPLAKIATLEPLLGDREDKQKALATRLAPPPTYFDSNLARCHANRGCGLGLRSTDDYMELLVTYRDMFCRMCYVYHCLEHGIEHPLPSHRVDPINPPLHLSPVALAAREEEEPSDRTPESSSPVPPDGTDASHKSRQSLDEEKDGAPHSHEEEGVHTDEDVVMEQGDNETGDEVATDDDASATGESHETRRSARSLTRISTLASRSLKQQAGHPPRRRANRVKTYPQVADESEYLDDSHYARVTAVVKKSLTADEQCSNDCWKAAASPHSPPANSKVVDLTSSLSDTELVLLRKLRYIIGDNPCLLASMVKSTTCREVRGFLEAERQNKPTRTGSMDEAAFSPDARLTTSNRKRGRTRTSGSSNNRVLLNRTRNNRLKEKGTNHEYEPCNHEGVCDSTGCSCMTRDHTCERACSCSRDCPNRFVSCSFAEVRCKCSLGNCRTKACPCFVAARECNPDLCFTCGASEAPVLLFDAKRSNMSALDLGICCNVNILRGLHKKIGVAYSTTHGWGAFAREPIKRGEFIYEYHGALLSQDEAERRGSIYDKMTISFLFDADDDSTVDAIRKGNKSKFANHSAVGQKCKGKVLTVGGEHRISIWAQQDIEKGEELFFDYGYHGETAPDWSQLRITGSARNGRKKEAEDEEKNK
ncbi:hypothetical protein BBJ28_00010247 [Nothophytophthora sp. Chile5]|nr:hypothetical protein BBJ28_00010247 [Nothophytophthora sp. Chile5]